MTSLKSTMALTLTVFSSISLASAPHRINAGDVYNDQAIQGAMGGSSLADQQAALNSFKTSRDEQPGLPAAPGGPVSRGSTHANSRINSGDIANQEAMLNGRRAEDVLREDAAARAQISRDNANRQREIEECANLGALINWFHQEIRNERYYFDTLRDRSARRASAQKISNLDKDLTKAIKEWNKCKAKLSR